MLDKVHNQVFKAAGPTLVAYLEDFVHHSRNVASVRLFHAYCFGRFLSELAQLDHFPYFCGRSSLYYSLHDFSVTVP